MAMNGNTMGQEVAAAIMNSSASPEAKAAVIDIWQKICTAMVKHITTNAMVPPGIVVSVDPVTHQGSTTGPGKVT